MGKQTHGSASVLAIRTANEYEAQHFGFSPRAFTDTVYNITLEAWSDVVSCVLYPRLVEIGIDDVTAEQKRTLHSRLASVICKRNMIGALFKKMEDYTLQYSFRIPNNVTLPHDQCNLMVDENADEELEIAQHIDHLKEDIFDIRMAIKVVDDEIILTRGILRVLKEILNDDHDHKVDICIDGE